MTERLSLQLPSPYRLVELECVDSTNAEAKRLAEAGADDFTLVWAHRQSAGRGRRGREWLSHDGNLTFSILLRLPYPMADVTQLSFVAANAVADALQVAAPRGTLVNVKWPNDVMIEGRKVAGILMEAEPEPGKDQFKWLVLGIGINVASHPSDNDTHHPATSLAAQGTDAAGLDVRALLDSLAQRFLTGLVMWRNLGFGPVRRQWLQRAQGLGGTVEVRLPNETLHGTFAALDESGALVLRREGQPDRHITAGDVFIPPSD